MRMILELPQLNILSKVEGGRGRLTVKKIQVRFGEIHFMTTLKGKQQGTSDDILFILFGLSKDVQKWKGAEDDLIFIEFYPTCTSTKEEWGHCKEYLGVSFSFYLKDTFAFHLLSCEANN